MSDASPRSNDRTLIGLLASFDSEDKNRALATCYKELCSSDPTKLREFHFLFTGGTFNRLFVGGPTSWSKGQSVLPLIDSPAREVILDSSTALPDRRHGGVTVLANYLVNRQCNIVWPFFDPAEAHWLGPENLALMRLCDVWPVKRLRNSGSVMEWFETEAVKDANRNQQPVPTPIKLAGDD